MNHAAQGSQVLRLAVEYMVIRGPVTGMRDIQNAAKQYDRRGQQNSCAQKNCDGNFYLSIGDHKRPFIELKIISMAKAKMTSANTIRIERVRAFTSTRAPSIEPDSTPSMTGMERPGSIYPRLR